MKCVFFHGTSSQHSIHKEFRLKASPEDRSYGDDEHDLASLDGVYVTSDPWVALKYAKRTSEYFCGQMEIYVIEVDIADAAIDEDDITKVLLECKFAYGLPNSNDIILAWCSNIRRRLSLRGEGDDRDIFSLIDKWHAKEKGETDLTAFRNALDRVSRTFRAPLGPHWHDDAADGQTLRILRDVGLDGSTRIIASVAVKTSKNGNEYYGLELLYGEVPEDLDEIIGEFFIENAKDIHGIDDEPECSPE